MFAGPVARRISAISSRFSEACVWTSERVLDATGARPLRAARASTTRRIAARRPRAAVRWPGRASAWRSRRSRRSTRACRSSSRAGTARVGVHHALADDGAQAHRLERLEHRVGVVHRLHRQHGGRAARSSSDAACCGRGRERPRRVRGLHRPDARLQPVEQRQVVGVAAEQRLAEVDVRLDEAGQQVVAASVDGAVVSGGASTSPIDDDAAVANHHVAFDHVEGVVHGEDGGVADEQRSATAARARRGTLTLGNHRSERRT